MPPKTPIERMLDQMAMICTICRAPKGMCNCWTECTCGWFYEKGGTCRNPVHVVGGGQK
jgi:hypothetical protein